MLSTGTNLGPYEILSPLGAGGMGEVYRATDTNLGRHVAIKILSEAFAQDVDRLARFEREARLLATLNHPNIAQIYGVEKTDGVRALVMELVEGPNLERLLEARRLDVATVLDLLDGIAVGLEAMHAVGIAHLDLKPANVIVREAAVLCGAPWFEGLMLAVDQDTEIDWHYAEGELMTADTVVCTIQANPRSLLTAERGALNFMQLLSGVATATRRYVDVVAAGGTTLTLDGADVSNRLNPLSGTSWLIARIPLNAGKDGAHVLEGSAPVGIQVMGYGDNTSYQYPGGLNLSSISAVPVK